MKTLLIIMIIANIWVVYEMYTAPYYDETTGKFIYKETIFTKIKKLFKNGI